jgi:transposase-like protein
MSEMERGTTIPNLQRQITLKREALAKVARIDANIADLCRQYSREAGTTNLSLDQVLRDIRFKEGRRAA